MLADTLDRPVRILISPGQASDVAHAASLLQGRTARHVIADRAYDAAHLRAAIADIGAVPVIPATRTREHPTWHDPTIYRRSATASSGCSDDGSAIAASQRPMIVAPFTISPPQSSG